jgi:hypothetical protein
MTKQEFINEHVKYAELRWQEIELGEQLIKLTLEQRRLHNEVRLAKEKLE